MKRIDEYLLSKNTPKTKKVVSAKVADHENDILIPSNYNSYIDFLQWIINALKEYGDLTDEEYNFFRPNGKHLSFYSDGSIVIHDIGERIVADFSVYDEQTTFIKLYNKVLAFIQENIDKMK